MSFSTKFKSAAAMLGVFPQTPSPEAVNSLTAKSGRTVGGVRNAPQAERFDKADFGDLPLVNSAFKSTRVWTDMSAINASHSDKMVWIRARLHTVRSKGKMAFIVLRRGAGTIQCLVADDGTKDTVPRAMVKYASKIYAESVVDVYGRISKVDQPTSCSQSDVEIKVRGLVQFMPVLPNFDPLRQNGSLQALFPLVLGQENFCRQPFKSRAPFPNGRCITTATCRRRRKTRGTW